MATREELFAAVRLIREYCRNRADHCECCGCPLYVSIDVGCTCRSIVPGCWPDSEGERNEMIISELHLEEEPKPHKCSCGTTPRFTYNGLLWIVECPKCFDFESGWSALDTINVWNRRVDKKKEAGKMTPNCSDCGNRNTPVCKYCEHDAERGGENGT